MSITPLVRIFCAVLLLASSSVHAAPTQFSEQLADWHRTEAAQPSSEPSVNAPLTLAATSDIRESVIRELVLLKGEAMLGTRYVYGSNEVDAVDCSALIQQLYQNAGIELPRTTHDLSTIGEFVSSKELQPGDLLFYRWKKHGLHVAIYVGDGLVLHASPGERSVVLTELNKTWKHHFVTARRVMMESDT
jgi:cell wall-associated NlpC family hydrolase